MKNATSFARRYLDKRFLSLKSQLPLLERPTMGWIKAIREALGLTITQLAERLGISRQAVSVFEQDECKGSITLATMERVALALNGQFVYAIIPNESLQSVVENQAKRKTDALLKKIGHTMHLENQATTLEELELQRKQLIDDLLAGKSARLWDKDE